MVPLACLEQMKLNWVLMKSFQTYDGIENIFYNEEGDVHDHHMSDTRDLLLTFDLDLSTIHID